MIQVNNKDFILDDSMYGEKLKYSELCDVLNIERQRGSKLQKQMNELRRCFDIVKEDKYYIILKKLTEKDKLDLLYYDNLKSHIEMLMCTLFTLPQSCKTVKFDMKGLMTVLQIVNQDYHETTYGKNKKYANLLLGLDDEHEECISKFFSETEVMLQRIIKETLSNLEDKQIITVTKIPVLARKVYNKKKNKILRVEKHELIEDEDIDAFMQCKKEVLMDMNLERESEVFARGEFERYNYIKEVARRVNHDYYFYNYKLVLNTKHIYQYAIQDVSEKRRIEKICNQLVKKKIITSKQGELKTLSDGYKEIYVNSFIDTENDIKLRYQYKELQKIDKKGDNLNVQ